MAPGKVGHPDGDHVVHQLAIVVPVLGPGNAERLRNVVPNVQRVQLRIVALLLVRVVHRQEVNLQPGVQGGQRTPEQYRPAKRINAKLLQSTRS